MASAELDYTIEIPDQPCWSQSDLTSPWVASAAVAPPFLRPRPPAGCPLIGSRRS
ncbi:Transmembrane protein 53 [Saguinus oedipus]|uniref:Transmembrane protein 53 n=1 Tax=Saguinus oedipus TaxID=9490 RepID=A0ABQ9VB67_SAGOE|nr:Transmembrane protein 53 [Saguinus oedipus]